MKTLLIGHGQFFSIFGRDTDYHDPYPVNAYLDKESGELLWVYEKDFDAYMEGMGEEDNKAMREKVAANVSRYLGIVGLNHGDHHDILQEFICTKWSDNEADLLAARSAYFGSIGAWLKNVANDNAKEGYYRFKEKRTDELGEQFLRKNGIEPLWK